MGNITGAMMFQSTIPVAFGVLFTPWNLQPLDFFAVVLALASGGLIFLTLRRSGTLRAGGLMLGGLFYVAFVIGAIIAVTYSGLQGTDALRRAISHQPSAFCSC